MLVVTHHVTTSDCFVPRTASTYSEKVYQNFTIENLYKSLIQRVCPIRSNWFWRLRERFCWKGHFLLVAFSILSPFSPHLWTTFAGIIIITTSEWFLADFNKDNTAVNFHRTSSKIQQNSAQFLIPFDPITPLNFHLIYHTNFQWNT